MFMWICASCGSVNEYFKDNDMSKECVCCGERISAADAEKLENKIFLTECAEKNHTGALMSLYIDEEDEDHFEESFKYLEKSAELNDPAGLYLTAMIYMDVEENCESYGVKPDMQKAINYLKKGYEIFDNGGVYFYLFFMLKGIGMPQNEKHAIKELIKYADAGMTDCQALLACVFSDGTHIRKNDKKAVYWGQRYLNSVEFFDEKNAAYDSEVRYIMGKHYFTGKHVEKDIVKSKDLLENSYAQGNEFAGLYLCDYVYPVFSDRLTYRTKIIRTLDALMKSENQEIANRARYLRNGSVSLIK